VNGLIVDLFAGVYVDRFWSRVDKSGDCWLWKGGRQKRPDGSLSYGIFCVGKKRILAHVYAWESQNGPLAPGQVLRHGCDNPPCVRHLEPGTQAQNLADMRERGRAHFNRFKTGTGHPNAKMDAGRVLAIRARRDEGASLALIGREFGLDPSTVHDIVRRRTWAHVVAA